jgi:hypothetical protein
MRLTSKALLGVATKIEHNVVGYLGFNHFFT